MRDCFFFGGGGDDEGADGRRKGIMYKKRGYVDTNNEVYNIKTRAKIATKTGAIETTVAAPNTGLSLSKMGS